MSSGIARWGGWAGVVAAVMYLAAGTLILIAPLQRVFGSISEHLIEIILVVAFAVTLIAIAGLHALQSPRYGRLGAAGSSITFIGYALIAVVTAVTVRVGGAPLFTVRLVGALAILIGSVLLGAMTLRARVLPWWCGVLLIVGFPLGDILDGNVARGGEEIVFGIVWGIVGHALLSSGRAPDQQHARVG
jgi:hypothetical protein